MVHGISLPSQNTLQKHSYHSPCKNEETEAQKQKALGQREPECREEAEVLPGTEQGIPLLPSAPHSLLYAGTGHTSQSWPCVEQKCAERQQQRMALGGKNLHRTLRMGWDSSSHKAGRGRAQGELLSLSSTGRDCPASAHPPWHGDSGVPQAWCPWLGRSRAQCPGCALLLGASPSLTQWPEGQVCSPKALAGAQLVPEPQG